jgi:lysophospholipase L1-like esterase
MVMLSAPALTGPNSPPSHKGMVISAPSSGHWVGVWGAPPMPDPPINPSFKDQTLRQVVRVSGGGSQIRLRLSNEYSSKPLVIGEVHVAMPAALGGAIVPGSDHVVTFSGSKTAVIPAFSPMVSDPIAMDVKPLSSLAVSIYVPTDTGPCECHVTGLQTGYMTGHGNYTGSTFLLGAKTFLLRAFLTGVEAQTPARAVVAFGDSLTDGNFSTLDRNRRWPDRLAERLNAQAPGRWTVVNEAIGGNRLLTGGLGDAGPARFDRDALGVPGVSHVIVLLGVNDLALGKGTPMPLGSEAATPPPYEEFLAGYRQLIAKAHAHGVKIYAGTIAPYGGSAHWSAETEILRQRVNQWLRTSKEWDGFIDFDAAWRDPAQPSRIKKGMGAEDHIHGSDAGYTALGEAIPLGLFN